VDIYFGGAEIPGWRKLLADEGVEHVAVSYMGVRRRVKRAFDLADKFPDNQKIFLDSGAYTVNKEFADEGNEEPKYTVGEIQDIASQYFAFVHQNIDRVEMVSEFDALVLGKDWIEAMREDFWDDLPDEKFMPIWHPEFGLEDLDTLAQRYGRVGIPQTGLGQRNLAPTLNGIVQKYGTKLHGVAMTKPDAMAEIRWDSVASTSWISPTQFGDTIVWVNNELKRYPKKYKDQARKRHRTLFEREGFDAVKIEADDKTEILRLSLWSFRQLVDHIDHRRGGVVTPSTDLATSGNTEFTGQVVDTSTGEVRNSVATLERPESERKVLPILGFKSTQKEGTDEEETQSFMRSASMRQCNSCFLASKCPAFQANYNCAFEMPLVIRTKEQYRSLYDTLIEMQAQRVAFMKMAEDLEGGYADPNLTNEIKVLDNLINKRHEMDQEGFSITMEAKAKGQAGVLSRLFGRDAGEAAQALPSGAVRPEDIIDVEDLG
jgi:hypothetical protein